MEWKGGWINTEARRPPWGRGWKINIYATGSSKATEPTGTIAFVGGWSAHTGLSLYNWFFNQTYETDLLLGNILRALRANGSLKEITVVQCTKLNGRIQYRGNCYVSEDDQLRLQLIQDHHDTALAGHPGTAKTFDLLDRHYYWKEMRKQVDQYVQNCHSCQHSRTSKHAKFGELPPLLVPEKPWDNISNDFVVGLPDCEGFDVIWVVVDKLSKLRHFIPCHTTIDAVGLAKLYSWEVVRLHGLPVTIPSDRGAQSDSTVWGQICSRLGIDQQMSTGFHPQTDSMTEQVNAGMEQYLCVYVHYQQDDLGTVLTPGWICWE